MQQNHSAGDGNPLPNLQLYGYWRSSASWRVRLALEWKGIPYQNTPVNLVKGEQRTPEFQSNFNPQALIPVLRWRQEDRGSGDKSTEDLLFTQSIAILEWLEEEYPDLPSLLPPKSDRISRQKARSVALMIACDIHPLQNLRILQRVGDEGKMQWASEVIGSGLEAVEIVIAKTSHSGRYAIGDTLSFADVCLIPQVYNAVRFGLDMSAFPTIQSVVTHCSALPEFIRAHPSVQPDAIAS